MKKIAKTFNQEELSIIIFFLVILTGMSKPRKKSKAQPFKIFNTSILGVRSKKQQKSVSMRLNIVINKRTGNYFWNSIDVKTSFTLF